MRRWTQRLLLLLMGGLFSLVAAELALRAAGVSYPFFYIHDYQTGAALRPGARGWWLQEGEAYIEINSDGLRDREHGTAKPDGTYRIAVLGDSYAEALQLPMEETFWAVMERELENCAPMAESTVEAINFGVSGYGTAQQLLALRHRAWKYEPDAVVLAITTGNDIRNNLRELEGDPLRPYFVFEGDRLTLDNSFRSRGRYYSPLRRQLTFLAYGIIDRSRFLQLLKFSIDRLRHPPGADLKADAPHGGEIGLDDNIYLQPEDPLWQEAWRVTEGLLELAAQEVRQKGAELLVVTLTNGAQVHPDPDFRLAYLERVGAAGLFYPERRIGGFCQEAGIPFLSLAERLQKFADEEQVYLHGFGAEIGTGHWNAAGHRLGGRQIARALCRLLEEKHPAPSP